MSDKANTWEAEVEARVKALEGELAKANATRAAREADVARLQATVDKHEAEAKARRDATCSAYVDDLRAHGTACGAPIAEAELEKVRAAFERGHDEVAKDLGEAYRARSSALGGAAPRSAVKTIKLGANEDAEHEADMAEFHKSWGTRTRQEA